MAVARPPGPAPMMATLKGGMRVCMVISAFRNALIKGFLGAGNVEGIFKGFNGVDKRSVTSRVTPMACEICYPATRSLDLWIFGIGSIENSVTRSLNHCCTIVETNYL